MTSIGELADLDSAQALFKPVTLGSGIKCLLPWWENYTVLQAGLVHACACREVCIDCWVPVCT